MSRKLISLDQASALLSEALTAVFAAIKAGHSVRGVSIFHTGQQYIVDMHMFNESSQETLSLVLQLAADAPVETTKTNKNPCSKTVKPEQAYEVWRVENHPEYGGTWTWYVLKKYQSPLREAANPYARWFCYVTSPYSPHGDYGDTYMTTIKEAGAVKLDCNPLVQTTGGHDEASQA